MIAIIKAFNNIVEGVKKFSNWFSKKKRRDNEAKVDKSIDNRDTTYSDKWLYILKKRRKARRDST